LETAQRDLAGARQSLGETEKKLKKSTDESLQTVGNLRKQLEEVEKQVLNSGEGGGAVDQAVVDEYATKLSTMTTDLIKRQSETDHLRERCEELERQSRVSVDESKSLLVELNALIPLKGENEEYRTRVYELDIALKAATERVNEIETQHEEESQNVQKQAMETVQAIRGVLQQERERSKKVMGEVTATLADLKKNTALHAKELEERAERGEELARQRQQLVEDNARQYAKEKFSLKDEIKRYTMLFKENQESANESRKGWMQQLQETQKVANHKERELHAEKEKIRRQMEDTRRSLEMELATTRTNLQATERRRKATEEEMLKIRDKLGKSESSAGIVIRLQAELSTMRERKEQAQNNARTLSARVEMLEKKVKDIRRATDMEKTTISMQYERQISILESKVLQM
jgi:chromosome segregation ATPase